MALFTACGALITLLAVGSPNPMSKPARRWELACFGRKRHYRKDGTCRHTELVLRQMRSDWYRARTRVLLFGIVGQKSVRVYLPRERMLEKRRDPEGSER